jgi:hypothetical protein
VKKGQYICKQHSLCIFMTKRSLGSAVRYGDWPKDLSSSPGRVKNYIFFVAAIPALRVHPASYPVGTGVSFRGV